MTPRLLTEQHFEFLCLTGGCTGSSESTLVKMPHCWKSHVAAQYLMVTIGHVGSGGCLIMVEMQTGLLKGTLKGAF